MLRVLGLLRLLGAVDAARLRVAAAARNTAELAVLYAIAALVGFIGILFLILALFLALASAWPAHWAAFAVFVILLVFAVMIVLYARQLPRRRFLPRTAPPPPLWSQAAPGVSHRPPLTTQAADTVDTVSFGIRRYPVAAMLGAVAIGLVLGLSRGRRNDT